MSGLLAIDRGDYSSAFQCFKLLLHKAIRLDRPENIGILLAGLAAVAAGNNDPERAAKLSGAALAFNENESDTDTTYNYREFSQNIGKARDQLGDETFVSLQNVGRLMTKEQLAAFAIG